MKPRLYKVTLIIEEEVDAIFLSEDGAPPSGEALREVERSLMEQVQDTQAGFVVSEAVPGQEGAADWFEQDFVYGPERDVTLGEARHLVETDPVLIDIRDLDKAEVLRRLHDAALTRRDWQPLGYEEAKCAVEAQGYFSVARGRVLRIDLSGDELDVRLYNFNNGERAAECALDDLL